MKVTVKSKDIKFPHMPNITVSQLSKDGTRTSYEVSVKDDTSTSRHIVDLDQVYYHELTGGKATPEALIERSFEFLLAREPKESILPKFNLEQISYYYPEYEEEITK